VSIAFVQGWTAVSGTGTHNLSAVDTTGGNFVVVCVAVSPSAGNDPTVSDNKGNTYNVVDGPDANGSDEIWIFVAENATCGSGHTITAPYGAGLHHATSAAAYSGMLTSGTTDKLKTGTGNSTSLDSGNSAALSQADELLIGFGTISDGTNTTFTAGAGFTIRSQIGNAAASSVVYLEDKIVSSTSADNADATWGGSAGAWVAGFASFKGTAASGGTRSTFANPGRGPFMASHFPPFRPGSVPAQGTSDISGLSLVGALGAGLLVGDGALRGASLVGEVGAANLTAIGTLSGASLAGALEAANLGGLGVLSGVSTVGVIDAALLTGLGALSGQSLAGAIEAALLTGSGSLSGLSLVGAVEAGFLDVFLVLSDISGLSLAGSVGAANLGGAGALAGVSIVGAVETAVMIATGSISGQSLAGALAAANLQALAAGNRKVRVIGSVIVRRHS
jgi:hypothetical protein